MEIIDNVTGDDNQFDWGARHRRLSSGGQLTRPFVDPTIMLGTRCFADSPARTRQLSLPIAPSVKHWVTLPFAQSTVGFFLSPLSPLRPYPAALTIYPGADEGANVRSGSCLTISRILSSAIAERRHWHSLGCPPAKTRRLLLKRAIKVIVVRFWDNGYSNSSISIQSILALLFRVTHSRHYKSATLEF